VEIIGHQNQALQSAVGLVGAGVTKFENSPLQVFFSVPEAMPISTIEIGSLLAGSLLPEVGWPLVEAAKGALPVLENRLKAPYAQAPIKSTIMIVPSGVSLGSSGMIRKRWRFP
jgi:hypothetical protein